MGKDDRILGLFLATVLTFTSGCSTHTHVDRDHNGYCDDCNTAMTTTSGSSGHSYYGGNSGSSSSSSPDASSNRISTASSPKGGIGSHSSGSGG